MGFMDCGLCLTALASSLSAFRVTLPSSSEVEEEASIASIADPTFWSAALPATTAFFTFFLATLIKVLIAL
jgi:hypothetical protein